MNIEIRQAEGCDASKLTVIAFAAKQHWGYPEAWIDLWAKELTVDGRYVEENRVVFLGRRSKLSQTRMLRALQGARSRPILVTCDYDFRELWIAFGEYR